MKAVSFACINAYYLGGGVIAIYISKEYYGHDLQKD